MSVTLAQAITEVRSLLNEPTAAFWSNTELTNWINEGCRDVARRAETKQTTAKITVTPTTQNFAVPSTAYRIHRVTFIQTPTGSSPNTYTLEFRGLMEMDQIWGINQNWPATYPLYYTLWGHPPNLKIITYPVTSTPGILNVFYYRQVVNVSTTTDVIDILPGYEDVIYDYACYRALRKDADMRWKDFQQSYEDKLANLIDRTRTFQDQANFFSTGQNALPVWLISDTMS